MSYAIVGFGKIGQALAHAFARKNIGVTVASRRPAQALAPQARAIGPTVVAKAFAGAKFVKGFNHLIAATLAADPAVAGGHRVVFLSSDDEDATAPVAALAKQLGFAPINLGKFSEGGALVHAPGGIWGPLIFQDVFKQEQ